MTTFPNTDSFKLPGAVLPTLYATSIVDSDLPRDKILGRDKSSFTLSDLTNIRLPNGSNFLPIRIKNPANIIPLRPSGQPNVGEGYSFVFDELSWNAFSVKERLLLNKETYTNTGYRVLGCTRYSRPVIFLEGLKKDITIKIYKASRIVIGGDPIIPGFSDLVETRNILLSDGDYQEIKFNLIEQSVASDYPNFYVIITIDDAFPSPSYFPATLAKNIYYTEEYSSIWKNAIVIKDAPSDWTDTPSNLLCFSSSHPANMWRQLQLADESIFLNTKNEWNTQKATSANTRRLFDYTAITGIGGVTLEETSRVASISGNNLYVSSMNFSTMVDSNSSVTNFNTVNGVIPGTEIKLYVPAGRVMGEVDYLSTWCSCASGNDIPVGVGIRHDDGMGGYISDFETIIDKDHTTLGGKHSSRAVSISYLPNVLYEYYYYHTSTSAWNSISMEIDCLLMGDKKYTESYPYTIPGAYSVSSGTVTYSPDELFIGKLPPDTYINSVPYKSTLEWTGKTEVVAGEGPHTATFSPTGSYQHYVMASPNISDSSKFYVVRPTGTNPNVSTKGLTTSPFGDQNFYSLPISYYSTLLSNNDTVCLVRPDEKVYLTAGRSTLSDTITFQFYEKTPVISSKSLEISGGTFDISELYNSTNYNTQYVDFTVPVSGASYNININAKNIRNQYDFYMSANDTYDCPIDDPDRIEILSSADITWANNSFGGWYLLEGDADALSPMIGGSYKLSTILKVTQTGSKFKSGDFCIIKSNHDSTYEWAKIPPIRHKIHLKIFKETFTWGNPVVDFYYGFVEGTKQTLEEPTYKINLGVVNTPRVRLYARKSWSYLRRGWFT